MKYGINYGARVESEHADVMRFIRAYLKKKKRLPSNQAVYRAIAKSHIRETPSYYAKLRKARL
jgi:sulfur relay (sulfurtransferase) DsrC/TusE family protein